MRFSFPSGTTVITGAASGIGAALACEIASRGGRLALVDVDAEGLSRTSSQVERLGATCRTYRCDLANASEIDALVQELLRDQSDIRCLINNAGAGMIGTIEQVSIEQFEWLMSVNFWGAVRLTKALLPELQKGERAQIVNVASILGIIAAPAQGPYVASKFALRGFSETLAAELRKTSVGVCVVYPGGVATAIARTARLADGIDADAARQDLQEYEKGLTTSAEEAAYAIADGVVKGRTRILIGRDARRADLLQRLMTARYISILARRLEGAAS